MSWKSMRETKTWYLVQIEKIIRKNAASQQFHATIIFCIFKDSTMIIYSTFKDNSNFTLTIEFNLQLFNDYIRFIYILKRLRELLELDI